MATSICVMLTFDPSIAPEAVTREFAAWVSGYYAHPSFYPSSDTTPLLEDVEEDADPNALRLERRTALETPPPTLFTLTDAERAAALSPGPGDPGGSDSLLLVGGIRSGLFGALREGALVLPGKLVGKEGGGEGRQRTDAWPAVEVRYVWCDRSVWEMPWGVWNMRARVEEGKKSGESLRPFTLLRVKGANHFVSDEALQRWVIYGLTVAGMLGSLGRT